MNRGSRIAFAMIGLALLLGSGRSWAQDTNTEFGTDALAHDKGDYNSAFGFGVLFNNTTGSDNTASGYGALEKNIRGNFNTASGFEALFYNTANFNTAIGGGALYSNTTGDSNDNTAIGFGALYGNTTGDGNTASGYEAGHRNTSGTDNTFIGNSADANAGTYRNGTALGAGALLTASNSIVLGNASISKISAKVGITVTSDRRLKKDIAALDPALGLAFVEKLQPVSYRFNNGDETERYGFIAQDLEQALPAKLHDTVETSEPEHGLALVERQNDSDRTYRVAYGELTAPMVKAIQEQQAQIEQQRQEIADLRQTVDALRQEMAVKLAQNSSQS
jgi:trimeric autotransporter adhesin